MNDHPKSISGIDWLTMTYTRVQDHNRIITLFHTHTQSEHAAPWAYRGFAGQQSPDKSLSYGWHPTMARGILIARGAIANTLFRPCLDAPSQVSRLDLQVTHFFDAPRPDYLVTIYEDHVAKRYRKSIIKSGDGGQTVYVGSRQSEQFFRIYDAGVRHGIAGPGIAYRHELELKKPLAKKMYANLRLAVHGGVNLASVIGDTVYRATEKRGIEPPWNYHAEQGQIGLQAHKEGKNSKLTWLTTQVNPCLRKLLDRGYSYDLLVAYLFDAPGPDR